MANHKSAEKRIRSSKRKAVMNKRVLTALKTCQKTLTKDIQEKNAKAVEKNLKTLFKLADKAKKRGIIKKNTASRKKSRFASQANKIS